MAGSDEEQFDGFYSLQAIPSAGPFRGLRCTAFFSVIDGRIRQPVNKLVPVILTTWCGKPFAEFKHFLASNENTDNWTLKKISYTGRTIDDN